MRNTRRLLLAVAAVGWLAAPAPAFYWLGWPGATPTARPFIPSTLDVVEHRPPPDEKPPTKFDEPPPPDELPPKGVPEPGTLGLAAVGLGVVAVRWWRKRKAK